MSRTTFYLSEEDTREFNRLLTLEGELYKIQYANLDDQWYQLACRMMILAKKCNLTQEFKALVSTQIQSTGETPPNALAYYRLKVLVEPFVRPTWSGSKN